MGSAALDRGTAATPAPRVLLLTQRFTPGRSPTSNPLAASLVAARGETEGFQLVLRSPGGRLNARLGRTSDAFLIPRTRILRVGFVHVRRPSTAIGRRGLYADPLPPQAGGGAETRAGRFAGFVVLVDVPADAAAGRYEGVVEVTGARGQVVGAARFLLRVAAVRALAPSDPRSFKVAGGISDGWYERLAPIRGSAALARRERQQRNLLGFLASHRVTPIDWSWTRPGRDGRYLGCS